MLLLDLLSEMRTVAATSAEAPAVRADWQALVQSHGLIDTPATFAEYTAVRLAFEATRDAGLWGFQWDITHQEPNEVQIWGQVFAWRDAPVLAVAECDELSAAFASVARALGVKHVGLFWPTSNHTVAVWTTPGPAGPVRVVVPTSQIFLDANATLGTRGFDPWAQRTIYDYGTRQLPLRTPLTPDTWARLVDPLSQTSLSAVTLQARRNARAREVGGS